MRWLPSCLILPFVFALAFLPAATAQEKDPPEEAAELETGKLRLALETGEHTLPVLKVFFAADSKQLVSVGRDQSIRYWDVETGELRRTVRTAIHARAEAYLQNIAYLPGGPVAGQTTAGQTTAVATVVFGGAAGNVTVAGAGPAHVDHKRPYLFFDPSSGRIQRKLELEGITGQLCLALSNDGKYLATGNFNGVRVWDAATGTLRREIKENRVTRVAFTSDGLRLAALVKGQQAQGSADQVQVINVMAAKVAGGKRKAVNMEVGKPEEVITLAWSADERNVLVGTREGIDVRDAQKGTKVKSLPIGKTIAMAWDAERRTLLTAGQSPNGKRARVSIVDVDSGQQPHHFRAPANEPEEAIDVAFSPDGKLVAAVAHERVIYIWPRDGAKRLVSIGTPMRSPLSVGWSKDGKTIAWGGRIDPKGRDLAERRPLQHAFDLAELSLVRRPDLLRQGRDLKEFQRAVYRQDGVTLNAETHATVVRGTETIKFQALFPSCTCGTLLPGDRAASNNFHVLRLFDTRTGKRIAGMAAHSEPISDLAPSPDGRYLLTASHDQTRKIFDVADAAHPRLLLTLFVAGWEWVIWTPEGYYAATPGGEGMMGATIHNDIGEIRAFLPAERFRKQLYRPDVIQRVLEKGSAAEALKVANDVRKAHNIAIPRGEAQPEKLLPPSVVLEIVDQKKLPKITVKVSAEQGCPEQPIKSLRLFVDGRPVPSRQAVVSFDSGKEVARHEATWEAEVPLGRHTLSVMARGKDDTPNFSNPIVVNTPLPENERPVVHHVAVGVSEYDRKNWNLKYAHSDAQQLSDAFVGATQLGKLYRQAFVKRLVNQDATREHVLAAIAEVRKAAKTNDLFVLSFAGHGIRDEGEFYLMTREADPTGANTLEHTALPGKLLREKLADFPCQVLLLLDACHSGALASYRPGSDDAARALADVDVRVAVMCAALGHEEALERNGGGLFTSAIVRALKHDPEAFYDKETGELNVYHLQAFVYQEVTKASEAQQTPYLKMPLAQPAFVVTQFTK